MKDFDFDNVGKKVPYKIPDSFLNEFTYNGVWKSDNEKRRNSAKIRFWKISFAAASVMLLLFTGIHFIKESEVREVLAIDTNIVSNREYINKNSSDVESIIKGLSDEELKILSAMIDSEMFNQ